MKTFIYNIHLLTLLVVLVPPVHLNATTHNILVSNFVFNPATLNNVVVGDVVKWVWVSGSHTTTSTVIPVGASTWDKPINSGSPSYSYTVTVIGTYNYKCTPHAGMGMIGTFTVINFPSATTGNATSVQPGSATLNGTMNANNSPTAVTFEYGTSQSYGSVINASQNPVTGTTPLPVSANISGLTPNTTYHFRVVGTNAAGTTYGNDQTFTTPPQFKSLTLKLFLEGLYAGNGQMNQAQNESGPQFPAGVADQVTVELHNSSDYSTIEFSSGLVNLGTSGLILVDSIPLAISGSFYISVIHHNSIETTTAVPVSFTGNDLTFDFSVSASQAFGNNEKNEGDGHFSFWGGDVNQDNIIDSGDMNPVDNASTAVTFGYIPEDINGDGIVDSGDLNYVDNNSTAIVMAVLP